jgi:hypothetical protein
MKNKLNKIHKIELMEGLSESMFDNLIKIMIEYIPEPRYKEIKKEMDMAIDLLRNYKKYIKKNFITNNFGGK